MPLALLPAAAFGLIIGSFLNVVAYRLPARVSLSRPGSHCPSCETPIKPYDNIPLLSWLLLRGRCRGARRRSPSATRSSRPGRPCCSPPSSPSTTRTPRASSSGSS